MTQIPLNRTQREFLVRYLGVDLPEAPPEPGDEEAHAAVLAASLSDIAAARANWSTLLAAVPGQLKPLCDDLSASYIDVHTAREALPAAIKTLNNVPDLFGPAPDSELNTFLSGPPEDRLNAARVAAATARNYLAMCDSNPVLSALDGNEFLDDVTVVAGLRAHLGNVVSLLDA
ncbi:hypothetical protein [Sedimentitalea sp.]|uniref:hypothetical protein n=1 Tax=Sedimentitalea sp. TaxID=2048915 RepID=UPI003297D15D